MAAEILASPKWAENSTISKTCITIHLQFGVLELSLHELRETNMDEIESPLINSYENLFKTTLLDIISETIQFEKTRLERYHQLN